jgi:hypothetical protein
MTLEEAEAVKAEVERLGKNRVAKSAEPNQSGNRLFGNKGKDVTI